MRVSVNCSTSSVSYHQCVACEAKAVAGLLYLNSHCTTTINPVSCGFGTKGWTIWAHHYTSIAMTILRFLFRFTGVASSGIDAYVRHSWHFMHKRSGDMEEEAPALHSLSLQLAKCGIISSCWRVCCGENFVCYSWMSSFLGTARGSRSCTTRQFNASRIECEHVNL